MHTLRVGEIMSSPAVTLQADHGIRLAEGIMRQKHLRHLPVVDQRGALVGLVTHRDLLQALGFLEASPVDLNQDTGITIRVEKVMRRGVWTVHPWTPILEAARMICDHKFGCLPVVEGGRVVGIVTEVDFLRLLVHGLEARRDREDTDPEIRLARP